MTTFCHSLCLLLLTVYLLNFVWISMVTHFAFVAEWSYIDGDGEWKLLFEFFFPFVKRFLTIKIRQEMINSQAMSSFNCQRSNNLNFSTLPATYTPGTSCSVQSLEYKKIGTFLNGKSFWNQINLNSLFLDISSSDLFFPACGMHTQHILIYYDCVVWKEVESLHNSCMIRNN